MSNGYSIWKKWINSRNDNKCVMWEREW
jgi:hypothetical protein